MPYAHARSEKYPDKVYYTYMELIKIVHKESRFFFIWLFILAISETLWNTGLLTLINSVIDDNPFFVFPNHAWLVYVVLMLSSLLVTWYFQSLMIKTANNIALNLTLAIFDRLQKLPFEYFQKLADEKIYTAMTDINVIRRFPYLFIQIFQAAGVILVGIFYLFFISFYGALLTLILVLFLSVFYHLRNEQLTAQLNQVRDLRNSFYKTLKDLLLGFKELKMNVYSNRNIFENFLKKNREEAKVVSIDTAKRYIVNELIGTYSWYIVIGVVLFVVPEVTSIEIKDIATYLVVLIFLIGSLESLVNNIPDFTGFQIAHERLEELISNLEAHATEEYERKQVDHITKKHFTNLKLEKLYYQYSCNGASNEAFEIGPIDLELNAGEHVFIVGGNGSGKSTLVYLLSGLYTPTSGRIFLNEHEISISDYQRYRNQISVIFSDHYMFSENYDDHKLDLKNAGFKGLLQLMQLEHKIRFDERENIIKPELSKGQNKRLALILELMRDNELIVLDEWAAEQDPFFRKYFYEELLPALKKQGKTVVMVSHDDYYFKQADRIVRLDYGNILSDEYVRGDAVN